MLPNSFGINNHLQKVLFMLSRILRMPAYTYKLCYNFINFGKHFILFRTARDYMFLSNSFTRWRCWSLRVDQLSNNSFCSGVREIGSSPSEKNWPRLIPKVLQRVSRVGMLGMEPRWNIFEIVDMDNLDSFARRYSDHPRLFISSRSRRIVSKDITSWPQLFWPSNKI